MRIKKYILIKREDMIMKMNIGGIDRFIRIVIGLFLLSLIFWGPKTLWGLIGAVPLLTALVGWCPPYAMLGLSTRKKKEAAAE
jgi:hypothetical protein